MSVLIRGEFSSHTNDDNKDHDTGVYVDVLSSDGSTQLAHVDNADNSGGDATEYNDGSDHVIRLLVDAPGVSRDFCKGFKGSVKIHTNGNDTWKFDAKITLYFDDGTNLSVGKNGITLSNDGASTGIP